MTSLVCNDKKVWTPYIEINKKNVIWKGAIIKQITSKDISYTFDNPIWIGRLRFWFFNTAGALKYSDLRNDKQIFGSCAFFSIHAFYSGKIGRK